MSAGFTDPDRWLLTRPVARRIDFTNICSARLSFRVLYVMSVDQAPSGGSAGLPQGHVVGSLGGGAFAGDQDRARSGGSSIDARSTAAPIVSTFLRLEHPAAGACSRDGAILDSMVSLPEDSLKRIQIYALTGARSMSLVIAALMVAENRGPLLGLIERILAA
jgi:hypothetical protein